MNTMCRRGNVVAVCALAMSLMATPTVARQDEQTVATLEDWQRTELLALDEVVRAAQTGQLVQTPQNDEPFQVRTDFLKGTDGNTYIPYTLTIDRAKVTASSLAVYVSIMPQASRATALGDPAVLDSSSSPEPVFVDGYFVDVTSDGETEGDIELSRAFTAPGGRYDVYVAIRDSKGAPVDIDEEVPEEIPEAPPVMLVKQQVDVPDFWNGQLQTSSLILAEVVEPLEQPLTAEQQTANPYTLGTTRIVPKQDASFLQSDDLSLIFLVYNPELTVDQTPDLTIEYDFHLSTEDGEEFFNKTNPQQFSAQTLPPGFDMEAGHQIVAGQSVPLGMFPVGDFRLAITVTDNVSGASLVREVTFNVAE